MVGSRWTATAEGEAAAGTPGRHLALVTARLTKGHKTSLGR